MQVEKKSFFGIKLGFFVANQCYHKKQEDLVVIKNT